MKRNIFGPWISSPCVGECLCISEQILSLCSAVFLSLWMFKHGLIWISALNWIYDALLSETPPFPQMTSSNGARFGCRAHLHLSSFSKAIIIPTIPPWRPPFLAALPYNLGFGSGLEAPFSQLCLTESWFSLYLVTDGKGIREQVLEASFLGRWVVIHSKAVLGEAVFYWPLGSSFTLVSSLMCYNIITPKSEDELLMVFR